MVCKQCGNKLIPNKKFCGACGTPIETPPEKSFAVQQNPIEGELVVSNIESSTYSEEMKENTNIAEEEVFVFESTGGFKKFLGSKTAITVKETGISIVTEENTLSIAGEKEISYGEMDGIVYESNTKILAIAKAIIYSIILFILSFYIWKIVTGVVFLFVLFKAYVNYGYKVTLRLRYEKDITFSAQGVITPFLDAIEMKCKQNRKLENSQTGFYIHKNHRSAAAYLSLLGLIPISIIVILVIAFIYREIQITQVQEGSPQLYPNSTWGEALEYSFDEIQWDAFTAITGEEIVEFRGVTKGTRQQCLIQFSIEESRFDIYAMEINNIPQSNFMIGTLVIAIFEAYENQNLSKMNVF